jgi:phosphonate transport system substrate-binding protein
MIKKIVLIVLVVLSLLACGSKEKVLNMVVIPADDAVSTEERYQAFVDYIEDGIGMKVNLMTVSDYAAVVEAMKYGHADIARFGPLNYAQATYEADIEPLVVGVKKTSGTAFYNSLIISRPDLENLNGATFAYVDPGSASGYGAPYVYMKENNIELGQMVFAGSHPAVIEAVKNGSVDAGAVADNRWYTALEEGAVTEDEVKVFATTNPIPNSPWAVQAKMEPKLKVDLLNVFLSMPEKLILSLGIEETRFLTANDADYDIMRKMLEVLD